MQIHDNSRADSPGSKSRHPAPKGSSDRLRVAPQPEAEDDVLSDPVAPPTDDTPTIISRNSPITAQPPDPDGIRGRRLAHFELLEPIGVGGMAAVLRARDTQLDRFVALKILPPEMASDDENVRRFHQEARSAARLDHENVARVFFCGEDQRLHFIAFEFVEGDNLRTILERRGRLPVAEALNYVIQVAAGLAHASARGVVHRDVKPSNIIITPSGRAKLVDMGLARTMERTGNAELTQSGVTLGTFDYISPEQALEPREADVRSDIYSLGCTFYHLLTGRTPTPEGTAAKKLHHHQHVNSVDPRHYVPDLPFDVVQILDRMMAKKPGDRFQTPEELVRRLLAAARTLGVHTDAPEGVLSVETTVPAPPPGRPLLWAGLAAVAVVALVFLLDPLSTSPQVPDPSANQKKPGDNDTTGLKDTPQVVKDRVEKAPVVVPDEATPTENVYRSPDNPTAEHLLKWLADRRGADRIELRLHGDLNLTPPLEPAVGLLVQAKQQVKILPRDVGSQPTIRLSLPNGGQSTALVVAAPQSQIEGIRFVLDTAGNAVEMAALQLRPGKHDVRRCEFIQGRAYFIETPENAKRVASLLIESGRGNRSEVSVSGCLFLGFAEMKGGETGDDSFFRADVGGRDAVVRRGPVKLDVSDCVFGPHVAAFRLEGGGDEGDKDRSAVSVKQCTVLLPAARSSAFEMPADARGHVKLDVAHCLFSRLDLPPADADGAVLLRQAGEDRQAITYQGLENVYHDLDGYWVVGPAEDAWRKAGWGSFRENTSDVRNASRLVLSWPWAAAAKRLRDQDSPSLVELLDRREIDRALRLDSRLPALRKGGRPGAAFVGAETVLGERLTGDDKTKLPPLSPRVLLVEKGANADEANGVYPQLHQAVESAKPGDVILVRHDGKDGKLPVKPIHLQGSAAADLTIRPARRFRPLLALGESDTDGTLFRVQDGKLRLEGLEFHVAPKASPNKVVFKQVSLLTLTGDGECHLSDCAVTLERTPDTPTVLASLAAKPDSEMTKGMRAVRDAEQGPLLKLTGCFVRGDGDLFSAKASRPCQLDVTNSVAALSGSLVSFNVPGAGEAPMNAKVAVNLSQATTYLGGPLMKLIAAKDSKDLNGVVPIHGKAGKCLFVAANAKTQLIQLVGPQKDAVHGKFSWTKEENNGYGGYSPLLTVDSNGEAEMQMTTQVNMARWASDYSGGEEGPDKVKLAVPAETKFTQLLPSAFKSSDKEAEGLGAETSKLRRPGS